MKFAFVNGTRVEATKGAKGTCPICGSELIAKCGGIRIEHWAHRGERNCDPWWEPETDWHRQWKNKYRIEWQEYAFVDEQTGEKHIADVRTANGLVLEFQHSAIAQKERTSREQFYKRMIWIADGSRLKRDHPRFIKGQSNWRRTRKAGIYLVSSPEECFPPLWLDSTVPVVFDFPSSDLVANPNLRNSVYCLFPGRVHRDAVVVVMMHEQFITMTSNGNWLRWIDNFMNGPGQSQQGQQVQPSQSPLNVRRTESQYVLERGRWVRRRRL
jgi:competence protein CoiA